MKVKVLVLIMLVTMFQLAAQWSDDTTVNTLVSNASGEQMLSNDYNEQYAIFSTIHSEGGGFITAWYDERNTGSTGLDIYIQKFDDFGYEQWTSGGVAVCVASGDQKFPMIVTDGSGGAIITWMWDDRNSGTTDDDIYAQRIDSSGTVQWAADGVAICTETTNQATAVLTSDGSGGAIIAWRDSRDSATNGSDIYAQKINSNGILQWTAGGVVVCNETGNQHYLHIDTDENGGAVIAWQDHRDSRDKIYAQRVTSGGGISWSSGGEHLGAPYGEEDARPSIVSDGSGGCIVVWYYDGRPGSGYNYNIAAQGINSDGSTKWSGIVDVCDTGGSQFWCSAVSDDNGGINITWWDQRSGDYHIYAQRVDSNGTEQWTNYGTPICTYSTDDQGIPGIAKDGSGGAVIAWRDRRNYSTTGYDLYAQRIDIDGNIQWTSNGIPISEASGSQTTSALVGNDNGETFIVWHDDRNSDDDLYCQLVAANGELHVVSQESVTTPASYMFSGTDLEMMFSSVTGSANVNVLQSNDFPQGADPNFSAEIYWEIDDGGLTSFDTNITFTYTGHLGSLSEADLRIYRNDGSGWAEWTDFTLDTVNDEITANGVTAFSQWGLGDENYEEAPLPVTLSSFTATFSGGSSLLSWTTQFESNNIGWNVYRSQTEAIAEGFQANEDMIEGAGTTTEQTDYVFEDLHEMYPGSSYFYWIESVDNGGTTELYGPVSVDIPGEDDNELPPEITANYGLYQNLPNPFNPSTRIAFKLKEDTKGTLEIYNTKGQLVKTLFKGEIIADDVNIFTWNGEDDADKNVGSGVYFYRLRTRAKVFTEKMIMMK